MADVSQQAWLLLADIQVQLINCAYRSEDDDGGPKGIYSTVREQTNN
jgi:hypothetical protein